MFVAVFGVIQIVLGMAGMVARERYLRDRFDEELTNRANRMVVELVSAEQPFSESSLAHVTEQQSRSIHFRDFHVEVRAGDGSIIARSNNLGVYQLPFQSAPQTSSTPYLQTVAGQAVEKLVGQDEQLRMATIHVSDPNLPEFYLQIATSLAHVNESVAFLRLLFILGVPAGLLTAAAASWLVTGSAMQRIHRVAQVAHQLQLGQPAPRLKVSAAHDEVSEMVEEFNSMLDRLEAGFAAQQRFIQEASHELKTPVSVLLSEAQVLRLTNGDAGAYQQFAHSVEEEMQRLGKLVESLLTLTRADGRSLIADCKEVDLNDAVTAAVQQCNSLAAEQDVQITLTLAHSEDRCPAPLVRGDPELLSVMVSNLIRNALRFSPAQQTVDVQVIPCEEEICVTVRDRGPGVPEDEIERIFERFAQASNTTPQRGTGLGLTIARSAADLHGGSIFAENMPDVGCRFTVCLPRTDQAHTALDRAQPPTAQDESQRSSLG